MTTGFISPSPVLQFFLNDGTPAVGGSVLTQIGGINATTYQDINLTIPLPNPIPLNSRGEVSNAAGASQQLFLPISTVYTFTLYDAQGNQIWVAPSVQSEDLSSITQQFIGKLLYPQTPAEVAAGVTPTNYAYPAGNILRYGAAIDGVTDDRLAVKTAFSVIIAQGGGDVVIPWGSTGVCLIASSDPPINVPTIQTDLSVLAVSTPIQIYVNGLVNARVIFQGSTMSFTVTTGGIGIGFDGFTNVRLVKPRFLGTTQVVDTVPTVAGVNPLALLSLTQNSTGFYTEDLIATNCYTAIAVFGDSALSAKRVTGVVLEGRSEIFSGEYGYVFQNNGDQVVIEEGYTFQVNRPIFIYGVSDMVLNIISDTQWVSSTGGGFESLIKAYGRGTRNITLNYKIMNNYEWSGRLGIQSQYNPANQAAPQMVENLYITIDDVNNLPFTTAPQAGDTSATLATAPGGSSLVWGGRTGTAVVKFSDNETRTVTFTSGSASVTWTGALTNPVANVATGGTGYHTYFSVYAGTGGTVQQPSVSLPVFNNIIIKGYIAGQLTANTALGTGNQCQVNFDGLTYTPAANAGLPLTDPFNNNGYISSYKFTYLPVLQFGGAAVGVTYGTQSGEYYIKAGLCTVLGTIILTSKGSSTGTATISMPFPTRQDSSLVPLGQVAGSANMASLTSTMIAQLASASSTMTPIQQGAASTAGITDSNFTNTSSLKFQISYPL